MITGVGTDIAEIGRIERAIEKKSFLHKCFTPDELHILKGKKPESYAGSWAAKEAVAKALGTGLRGFWPCDVEILRDDLGKPVVRLHNAARALAEGMQILRIHVSISHDRDYALAMAVAEGRATCEEQIVKT